VCSYDGPRSLQAEAHVRKRRKPHSRGAPSTSKTTRGPLSRREARGLSALRLPTPPATESRKRRKVVVADPEVADIPPPTPPASSPTPAASKKEVPVTPALLPSNAPRPPVGARLLSPPRFEVMRAPTTPPRPVTQVLRSLQLMDRKRGTAATVGSNTTPSSLTSSITVTMPDADVCGAAPAPAKRSKTSKKSHLVSTANLILLCSYVHKCSPCLATQCSLSGLGKPHDTTHCGYGCDSRNPLRCRLNCDQLRRAPGRARAEEEEEEEEGPCAPSQDRGGCPPTGATRARSCAS
jgi:hypothetical protein